MTKNYKKTAILENVWDSGGVSRGGKIDQTISFSGISFTPSKIVFLFSAYKNAPYYNGTTEYTYYNPHDGYIAGNQPFTSLFTLESIDEDTRNKTLRIVCINSSSYTSTLRLEKIIAIE